jgi:integrase
MRFKHGAYYRVVRNRWQPLGKQYGDALRQWAELEAAPAQVTTIGQALDIYLVDELARLAPATQREYRRMSGEVRRVFGDTALNDLEPTDIAQYLQRRTKSVQANREMALLSSVYNHAMRLGHAKENPCRGVRRNRESRRTRLPTPAELAALLMAASPSMRLMIMLSLATGMRKKDLIEIQIADLSDRGIEVRTSKTGAPICFTWTPEIRALCDQARGNRNLGPLFISPRARRAHKASGLDKTWDRLRIRARVEGLHWHDLRAWALTMADRTRGREYARILGSHKTASTTDRYLRDLSAREVEPLNARQLLGYETSAPDIGA